MLAKIYRPAKNAMQSGKANTQHWVLEFEAASAPRSDDLMGWTGSADTSGQVRLTFETQEQAIAYARAQGLAHQVIDRKEPARITKSYADNFAFRRREPWSH